MTLVVLAAGLGSRYGGLKQMDPVTDHGEFIIDFSIYDAIRAGYDKVVFIIKRENHEAFSETIGRRIEPFIKVEYAYQDMTLPEGFDCPPARVKPFGTAHALLACKGLLDDDFAVINADDFYGAEPYRLAYEYMKNNKMSDGKKHYCMVGYRLGNTLTENGTVSRGICERDENHMMTSITERTKIKPDGDEASYFEDDAWHPISADSIASMNFFAFSPAFLSDVENGFLSFLRSPTVNLEKDEYYLPTAASTACNGTDSDLKVLRTDERWYGVTYREDREHVVSALRSMIADGRYPDGLWVKR